ncbi:helix-turn-helix transcriptional regulator [Paramicrobacterium agarici]|uniref:Proteasome accessory factor C n=1 Tax=Paramicrobacterium agarici TaxID=630514 RepID=A0A2A9DZR3_9MICO|nr:WYL domain-containing protein [Microbacterium agarici]PFG31409.1 proteasome accessory factor C [Microbacterium agarici]TQO21296.1 proteasome accessory factor C [Microbacterium agarici]
MTPRTPGARDKLAFLLSLVPYLLDRRQSTVAEAAAHFDVAEEQVRQSVRLIAVSGVPGESSQYQHNDLFDIDWDAFEERDEIIITHLVAIDDSPRFSSREAAALIAGLQYLSALPEQADRDVVGGLMAKLTRGASEAPIQVAVERGSTDGTLADIREAVASERQIEFTYINARDERERRRVDPLRIDSLDQNWYVRAWCHLRGGVRTFRLDRMSDVRVIDAEITHRAADVTLPDTLFQTSDDDVSVIVDIAKDAVPLIDEYIASTKPGKDPARVTATLRLAHIASLGRLIVGLPGQARVLDPPEARDRIAHWASRALSRYENDRPQPRDAAHS